MQDTTAQIRVRGAFRIVGRLRRAIRTTGTLETILGAIHRRCHSQANRRGSHVNASSFSPKTRSHRFFGVFIPVFFITIFDGIQFDLKALIASPATILRVPLFLLALLLIRGVPALLYRQLVGNQRSIIAGLLQATSLSFIVAASQIGLDLGLLTKANVAA
ncbi:hypothetical protein KSZ_78060 [Dictyobacter formicarum]|uniref:Cation/H+ exchanger transmembrane domain-containing protein n=1 Tax=Dictyobacter formicarum TaxID=2778368 RepID=A0ABQ3VU86_9CHLR|nr:hypothetical protein KSZ_78060 [Dictyobacter formicarum]